MFRQIFLIPLAGLAAIVLSITASPSNAAPLTTTGIIGDVEQALGTNPILVEEGNRTRARDVGKRPRRAERSRSGRKVQRSERRARKAERRARRAERSRSERRASRSERRARKAERRARRAERRGDRRRDKARRHDRRKHAHKRHRHKHKRHRRHRSFGYYGYGGFYPYFPYDRYDYYGGYDYGSYDPYYEPRRRTRISCKRARKKLRRNGYRKMRAYDCRGKVYGFYAWRGKYRYKIRVSAYTNRILVARRI